MKRVNPHKLLIDLALFFGTDYSNAQSASNDDATSVLFEGVRVLTMTAAGVLDDVDVLVTGEEIRMARSGNRETRLLPTSGFGGVKTT